MKNTFYILLLFTNILLAQNLDYNNGYEAIRICTAIQGNNFASEKAADNALDKILSVIGASKRFVLQECSNINNAVALTFNGVRYIMYDPEFMSMLNYSDDWSNMFILAHEVGHHINGHSVDVILGANGMGQETSLTSKRIQELEADEFAGFVLGRLGANLSQAQSAIKSISNTGDDSYSTHPNRTKRLAAVKKGFNNSGGYIDYSNLDIKKGKTVDSPYSNTRYGNVSYYVLNDYYSDAVYKGYVSNSTGDPFGYGTLFLNSGDKYEGEFSGGKMNGYGKFTWISGNSYEGFWVDNQQNGEGVYIYAGEKRTGFFSEGTFIRGTVNYPNGDKEEGSFSGFTSINTTLTKANGEVLKLGFLDGSKGNGYTTYTGELYTLKGFFKNGNLIPQYGGGYVGVGENYKGKLSYLPKLTRKDYKKKQISCLGDFIPEEILNSFSNYVEPELFKYSLGEEDAKRLSGKKIWNFDKGDYMILQPLSSSYSYYSDKYLDYGYNYVGNTFSIAELSYTFTHYKYKGWFNVEDESKAGYGELTLSDGSNYKGMFWDSDYNGYGVLTKSDGTVLKGLFRGGEFVKAVDFDFDWMQRTMKKW